MEFARIVKLNSVYIKQHMVVPQGINRLRELHDWVLKNKPDLIEVNRGSEIESMMSTGLMQWKNYMGIKIRYFGNGGRPGVT
jgi:hypothetical protein